MAAIIVFNKVILMLLVFFLSDIFCTSEKAFADDIQKAESWFAKVKTLRADFTQIASDGSSSEGRLVMSRPHRLKIEYNTSPPLKLITTSEWLHVDQSGDRQLISYPISETPLSLLLTEPVSLQPLGYETKVDLLTGGIMQILIDKGSGEGGGRLTLEFTLKPFQLRRWTVVDVAGVKTIVTLQNTVFDSPVKNEEFTLPNYSQQ